MIRRWRTDRWWANRCPECGEQLHRERVGSYRFKACRHGHILNQPDALTTRLVREFGPDHIGPSSDLPISTPQGQ